MPSAPKYFDVETVKKYNAIITKVMAIMAKIKERRPTVLLFIRFAFHIPGNLYYVLSPLYLDLVNLCLHNGGMCNPTILV